MVRFSVFGLDYLHNINKFSCTRLRCTSEMASGGSVSLYNSILTFCLLAVCAITFSYGEKTECYVDENGDKADPNNIYKCAKDHTCCREEGLPSCCKPKDSNDAIWEQVTLWGILIGGILILGLVMWCCRHDGDCCCNAKDGRKSCCGKAYGKKPEDNYADGYGIPSDTDDETDSDEDDDGKPAKQEPPKDAQKQSPEKKPQPPPADEKKPPPSPKRTPPSSPQKDLPKSPAKKHLPSPEKKQLPSPEKKQVPSPAKEKLLSPAKKHLPSPEKLPKTPSTDIPVNSSQLKLDEIP
ncbi:hypothetical protein FHG87_002102 [Trinorchestia longiramus]|nr:hypothetical protein FHG87_002102 [Trinorchestia longiramus]